LKKMPKIRVTNKDRLEDDVMEEILQDPVKYEELLKEREKPPVNAVKKFVSPVPSRRSESLRSSERVDIADDVGESRLTESPSKARLVSENMLQEPRIFVHGADQTKDHYRKLTDKDWIKWRSQDPVSFDDRYERCGAEEGPYMYRKRASTSSGKTTSEAVPRQKPIGWEEDERSAEFWQQFEGKDGTKPFKSIGRDIERIFLDFIQRGSQRQKIFIGAVLRWVFLRF